MLNRAPILTVSQLNRQVKSYLEHELGLVSVEGELSNLTKPASGHFYFTLKDNQAQIRCVFFKKRHVSAQSKMLSNGQHIVATGRLSLYEARGDYQLIIEQLTEAGLGALYLQYEELKNRLAAEGLFSAERKKAIPALPRAIGVITSNSGAAVQDILATLSRRYPLAPVYIYPSDVQGQAAPQQLISALQQANRDKFCDVLILGRGGGSIEDLWAFNNENLARALVLSSIPVISGVGHETDFTIADFVADLRAETPTAAATAATPNAQELMARIRALNDQLNYAMVKTIEKQRSMLKQLTTTLSSPHKAIASYWQTLDYIERQLLSEIKQLMLRKTQQLNYGISHLHMQNPQTKIKNNLNSVNQLTTQLVQLINQRLKQARYQLTTYLATLHAVSPLATLDRGYSITSKDQKVIFNTTQIRIGDTIDVRLSQGTLGCTVTQIKE
ncbi:MAG: exodeoxyribonuclease VII large subunit [Legionella sp.]